MKRRKLKSFLMLTVLSLIFTTATLHVSATAVGPHEIEFLGKVCNPDGTSTWTYNVTSGLGAKEVSHWIIAWCGGESSVNETSHPNDWEYVLDPTTGIQGIKFDVGVGEGETETFWFTLDKCYANGTTTVAIKDGSGNYTGTIEGPVFTYDVTAYVQGEDENSTYMTAIATTDYPGMIDNVTFRWYGPFENKSVAGPIGGPKWTNVTYTAPFNSTVGPITEDDLGTWYIQADFNGPYHPGTADTTLDPVLVPWFTSLPLILALTVGLLVLFKKRTSLKLRA